VAYRASGKSGKGVQLAPGIRIQRTFPLATGPGSIWPDLDLKVALPPPRARSVAPHCAQINTRSYAPALKLSRVSLPTAGVGEPEASRASRLCAVVRDCIGQNRYPAGSAPRDC